MQAKQEAVPHTVRVRLASVLRHLEEQKHTKGHAPGGSCADSCTSHGTAASSNGSTCSGSDVDMEDLVCLSHAPRKSHQANRKKGSTENITTQATTAAESSLQHTSRLHSADFLDAQPGANGLFDPQRFEGTRRPLAEAETLPPECYNSHAWFDREMARVFMPSWTLVGRGDEIEEPGSYIALDTEWGG